MVTKIPAYRQAQVKIKEYIEVNKLKANDALPPEARMAEELNMSRPSLREAVKALESLGVIESRHGEGIYVKAFSFDSILENLPYSMVANDDQITDLLYARSYLEIGALPSVVAHIGPKHIEVLCELSQTMLAKALAHETFAAEDRAFHAEMYSCLDNRLLSALIDLFWNVFNNMLKVAPQAAFDPWAMETTARDHIAIVDMLEKRDTAGLMEAYTRHFEGIYKRYPKQAV